MWENAIVFIRLILWRVSDFMQIWILHEHFATHWNRLRVDVVSMRPCFLRWCVCNRESNYYEIWIQYFGSFVHFCICSFIAVPFIIMSSMWELATSTFSGNANRGYSPPICTLYRKQLMACSIQLKMNIHYCWGFHIIRPKRQPHPDHLFCGACPTSWEKIFLCETQVSERNRVILHVRSSGNQIDLLFGLSYRKCN